MRHTLQTTIELDVTVTCTSEPYVPAVISGPAEACHPAEGGEIDDIEITATIGGRPVRIELEDLSAHERECLTDDLGMRVDEDQSCWDRDQ